MRIALRVIEDFRPDIDMSPLLSKQDLFRVRFRISQIKRGQARVVSGKNSP